MTGHFLLLNAGDLANAMGGVDDEIIRLEFRFLGCSLLLSGHASFHTARRRRTGIVMPAGPVAGSIQMAQATSGARQVAATRSPAGPDEVWTQRARVRCEQDGHRLHIRGVWQVDDFPAEQVWPGETPAKRQFRVEDSDTP